MADSVEPKNTPEQEIALEYYHLALKEQANIVEQAFSKLVRELHTTTRQLTQASDYSRAQILVPVIVDLNALQDKAVNTIRVAARSILKQSNAYRGLRDS